MKNFTYQFVRKILWLIFTIVFRWDVNGRNNIPDNGKVIVMSNHISNLDPPILCTVLKRPIRFMAKKELFTNPLMRFILNIAEAFPVDRSKTDIKAFRHALRILADGEILGIFPEGTRCPEGKPGQPKSGSVMLAVKSEAPIVPVGIKNIKRKGKVTVNIGEPFTLDNYYNKKLSEAERDKAGKIIMTKIIEQINL
ncbi:MULTISPECIES: 1-acyl-sn-glycerol-3-phosphate acyltransferase [unclassified Halanaerobium]|uniref:lysophospholipid acyltransferase family protein n=1 Tax=unclassified Halanaerobium TaxID=2641197 RepID=UPI000DF417EB|nr:MULTISPECIES: lysophospholipid acyltransferase family protein [unclassified Halanaerobium]RCW51457.1 1-acyl-sn-glycerol-3-phosphate acyltransferase [Halanaerobium sp. MA284_MarDTE_T2]RCW89245.1 1-acyl-sn-glycerol-3-phosphate acyltransferase [Halanaerobium sp. DL-01]